MKGDYTLEAIEVRQEIKDKASKYITKETGKRPVILPIIIESVRLNATIQSFDFIRIHYYAIVVELG